MYLKNNIGYKESLLKFMLTIISFNKKITFFFKLFFSYTRLINFTETLIVPDI